MSRKDENRAFIINSLKSIARNKKVLASFRLRAIDRIAVIEEFYPIVLVDNYSSKANRDAPDIKTDLDNKVEQMLNRFKEEDNASKLP